MQKSIAVFQQSICQIKGPAAGMPTSSKTTNEPTVQSARRGSERHASKRYGCAVITALCLHCWGAVQQAAARFWRAAGQRPLTSSFTPPSAALRRTKHADLIPVFFVSWPCCCLQRAENTECFLVVRDLGCGLRCSRKRSTRPLLAVVIIWCWLYRGPWFREANRH
jgi:hypothetical protein